MRALTNNLLTNCMTFTVRVNMDNTGTSLLTNLRKSVLNGILVSRSCYFCIVMTPPRCVHALDVLIEFGLCDCAVCGPQVGEELEACDGGETEGSVA